MKLILTRHGETFENRNGIMMGHNPGHLTEKGINQAKELAEKLKQRNIDIIFSSDLDRARKTAEIITYTLKAKMFFTKKLREKDIKEYAGKKKQDYGYKISDFTVPLLTSKNGETNEQMIERARLFLRELEKDYSDKTILIVSHNAITRALISHIENIPFDKVSNFNNTEYKEYDFS